MPSAKYTSQVEQDKLIIRVLRFIRNYLHVSTSDLSKIMGGEFHSRSLIAGIENDTRMPNPNFISEYAKAIQIVSELEGNILYIVQECIKDEDFVKKLELVESGKYSFITIYDLTTKIWELNLKASRRN